MVWPLTRRKSLETHAALTDTGKRHKHNEDAVVVIIPPDGAGWGFDLAAIVADGVSGQAKADAASTLAIDMFRATLSQPDNKPAEERLVIASAAASAGILDLARREAGGVPVASTVVALVISGSTATVGHVGNSRAYRLRNGSMEQLTEDHSVVAEGVRQGLIAPADARKHPMRSRISRALGTPQADSMDTGKFEARTRDIFLLCSDGLHDVVDDAEIKKVITEDVAGSARRLIDLANAAGGPDNITVALYRVP